MTKIYKMAETHNNENNILLSLDYLALEAERTGAHYLGSVLKIIRQAYESGSESLLLSHVANDDDISVAAQFLLKFLMSSPAVKRSVLREIQREEGVLS